MAPSICWPPRMALPCGSTVRIGPAISADNFEHNPTGNWLTSAIEIHFQDIEPAGVPIDGVDDTAFVDEHVVELDGAVGRGRRRGRHEDADLQGAGGVRNVVGA